MLAAVCHVVASTVVIFNSARLVRWGEHLEAAPLSAVSRPAPAVAVAPAY